MKLTVEDLKKNIRNLTKEMNKRMAEAFAENYVPPQIDSIIARLQKVGSKPSIKNRSRDHIGLGFKGKKKKDLIKQERELSRYLMYDVWTPEGMRAQSQQAENAYLAFKKNQHVDWTYEKWRDFVNFMDDVSSEVLNAFNYEKSNSHRGSKSASGNTIDLVGMYTDAYEANVNLGDLMEEVYNELPEGGDQNTAIDILKEKIKERIQ